MKILFVTIFALLFGCEHQTTTHAKMCVGEVSIMFDQLTGDTVSITYKGKSFVSIDERDQLLEQIKLYTDSLNIATITSKAFAYNVWKNGYLTAWTHRYDRTDFHDQIKKDSVWFSKKILN